MQNRLNLYSQMKLLNLINCLYSQFKLQSEEIFLNLWQKTTELYKMFSSFMKKLFLIPLWSNLFQLYFKDVQLIYTKHNAHLSCQNYMQRFIRLTLVFPLRWLDLVDLCLQDYSAQKISCSPCLLRNFEPTNLNYCPNKLMEVPIISFLN